MTTSADRRSATYSPDMVRSILQRATEIDSALASGTTEQDLRQIASEIGLSQRALDLALEELSQGVVTEHESPKALRARHVAYIGAGAGLAVALFQAAPVVVFITLQACSFVLAAAARGPNRLRNFVVSNAALWSGVLVAPILVFQLPTVVLPVLALAGSTVLGIAAIYTGGRPSAPGSHAGPTTAHPSQSRFDTKLRKAWEHFVRLNNATDVRLLFSRRSLQAE